MMKKNRIKFHDCAELIDRPRNNMAFAASLRMARAALGWSQVEFGQLLGMTQRSVHRIEQGGCEPRRTTLLAIESLLRQAGLQVELRSDGSLCIVVPASALLQHIAAERAPLTLADSNPQQESNEMDERTVCGERADLQPSLPA